MAGPIRVLLLADTHLGFDEPAHARIERRRRGPDFLANFERALLPALRGEVDAVVHDGDRFYRSRVPASLVERAFRPLAQIAAAGTPVGGAGQPRALADPDTATTETVVQCVHWGKSMAIDWSAIHATLCRRRGIEQLPPAIAADGLVATLQC